MSATHIFVKLPSTFELAESTVQCPVCNEEVVDTEINLHLDLRCRGLAGPSSSAARSSQATPSADIKPKRTTPSASQAPASASGHASREVFEVGDDTPPRPTQPKKPVASIFGGGVKRKKPLDDADEEVKPKDLVKRAATQREAGGGEVEKKSRINPLIAAQPYV